MTAQGTPPADPVAPPPTPPIPPAPEQQIFSAEYVKELRRENKLFREKARELEAQAQKAQKDAEEATLRARSEADSRIIRAELKAAAIKAGMVDVDGLKLADLSQVSLKDDGTIDGVEAMLNGLKQAKPYLFAAANTSHPGDPPPATPPAQKRATEMTDAEYAAAKKALVKN